MERKKSNLAPLFVMRTVAAAIISEEGLSPLLYGVEIEREQLEMGKPMMKIGKTLLPLWVKPRK